MATLGPLPKHEIAAGAGFYSLTRQLGSSIGIALITTLLTRQHGDPSVGAGGKDHRLSPRGAWNASRGSPANLGHERAMALLDRIVNGQAALLSYADLFFYVAVLFVVSLPLLLLLGDSRQAPAEAAAAH